MNKSQHGGPDRGQGRHEELGYAVNKKCRFLDKDEELLFSQATPRQRVELVLDALRQKELLDGDHE